MDSEKSRNAISTSADLAAQKNQVDQLVRVLEGAQHDLNSYLNQAGDNAFKAKFAAFSTYIKGECDAAVDILALVYGKEEPELEIIKDGYSALQDEVSVATDASNNKVNVAGRWANVFTRLYGMPIPAGQQPIVKNIGQAAAALLKAVGLFMRAYDTRNQPRVSIPLMVDGFNNLGTFARTFYKEFDFYQKMLEACLKFEIGLMKSINMRDSIESDLRDQQKVFLRNTKKIAELLAHAKERQEQIDQAIVGLKLNNQLPMDLGVYEVRGNAPKDLGKFDFEIKGTRPKVQPRNGPFAPFRNIWWDFPRMGAWRQGAPIHVNVSIAPRWISAPRVPRPPPAALSKTNGGNGNSNTRRRDYKKLFETHFRFHSEVSLVLKLPLSSLAFRAARFAMDLDSPVAPSGASHFPL